MPVAGEAARLRVSKRGLFAFPRKWQCGVAKIKRVTRLPK